jgi:hypothetical protein
VNAAYLKQLNHKLAQNKQKPSDKLNHSWLGKLMIKQLKPSESGQKGLSFKAPASVNPKALKQKGYAVVDKIVFRDLLSDLSEIEQLLKKIDEYDFQSIRIKSLVPLIPLNGYDALALMLAHTERHLIQAKKYLES